MEIKKISGKGNELKVLVEDVEPAFLNAIRRTVMNAVPSLAIEDVMIYENHSVIFDEFLALRLGLIPLKAEISKSKEGDKVKFTLDKEGPCRVYSGDIKIKNSGVDIADKKIPLVELKKNQKLKLEGEAIVGTGKEHIKWQPALVSYHELPDVKGKKGPEDLIDNIKGRIAIKEPYKSEYEDAYASYDKKKSRSGKYVLLVESNGAMEPQKALEKAADIISEKLSELKKEVKKL